MKGIIFHVFASFVLIFIIMLLIGAIPSRQVMPNMYTYFWIFDTPCHITSCFRSTRSTLLCRMYVQSSRNWSWLNLMNIHLIFMHVHFFMSARRLERLSVLSVSTSLQLQVCVAKWRNATRVTRVTSKSASALLALKKQLPVKRRFICANWVLNSGREESREEDRHSFSDIKY